MTLLPRSDPSFERMLFNLNPFHEIKLHLAMDMDRSIFQLAKSFKDHRCTTSEVRQGWGRDSVGAAILSSAPADHRCTRIRYLRVRLCSTAHYRKVSDEVDGPAGHLPGTNLAGTDGPPMIA